MMNLKKGIIRNFAIIMAVLSILNLGSSICSAENVETAKNEVSKQIISTENKENSYSAY